MAIDPDPGDNQHMAGVLLPCLLIAASSLDPTSDVTRTDRDAWHAQLHAGAGQRNRRPVTLLQPALSYRHDTWAFKLSAPLWMQPSQPIRSTRSWATYVGFIESLRASAWEKHLQLDIGRSHFPTLGHGALVDHLGDSLDPSWPASAGRLDVHVPKGRATMLIDDVARPHVAAARVDTPPLTWLGMDEKERLRVAIETAWELAPERLGASSRPGGVATDVTYAVYRGDRFAAATYVAAAALAPHSRGYHLGLELEIKTSDAPGAPWAQLRMEAVDAARGYEPGYFDAAYGVERWRLPDATEGAKHTRSLGHRQGARISLTAQARSLTVTAVGSHFAPPRSDEKQMQLLLHVRWQGEQLALAGLLLQRDAAAWGDLVRHRDGTYLGAEGSVRLLHGWFTFVSGTRGTVARPTGHTAHLATWIAGIGFSGTSQAR